MYLLDTDVISEVRKGENANSGIRAFFDAARRENADLYLSAITTGELRQGVERIRHRGDTVQARRLERWLAQLTTAYAHAILPFDERSRRSGDDFACQTPKTRSISRLLQQR